MDDAADLGSPPGAGLSVSPGPYDASGNRPYGAVPATLSQLDQRRGPARPSPPDGGGAVDPLPGTPSHLDPRVRLLWSVLGGGPLALCGLVVVVIAATQGSWQLALGLLCLTVAVTSAAVVGARLAWSRWTWAAYDDALELRHGVMVHSCSLVPYHRIQQIDLHRGPLQRVFGVSRLVLRTAAATTDASLPGLGVADADRLRYQLLQRADVDDAV